jgi:hypothetical protein
MPAESRGGDAARTLRGPGGVLRRQPPGHRVDLPGQLGQPGQQTRQLRPSTGVEVLRRPETAGDRFTLPTLTGVLPARAAPHA